jgi:LPXTG-motif cell wall-anchored protein
MDFMNSWGFMGIMGALLVGLVILLVIMQKKKNDD